ncbi:hypothetical protein SmJEL517_g02334 [Synchytrium microbalum]|uniref:DNA damage-binding protein 1 n=1 Tax=Synchytrium microbalum TaxID=1806994 RepID=A0A507C2F5_9FUNG|nr:uncharacterized protein SmJEL517_g02334 [Synchytrium microbalum]TPX35307.1 hypothetical protein SmJEL517_g02334 [Synchytrium microbalum]
MFTYALTLQPPTGLSLCVLGNFSGTKQQEIIVAKGSILELLKLDSQTGKINTLLSHQVFGIIRSIAPFRLTGASKDYLIVGSDSGRIVILEYNPVKNVFDKVHQETYGKSGVRRIVPGQHLAADPKGRAVMIGAMEKQKLVYVLNRDSAAKLTISSPLEAHKSNTIVHHMAPVDVGFENPIFACLEVDYTDSDQDPTGEAFNNTEKLLVYYELDLGLNHVVRKWSEAVNPTSNLLITVPGGVDGPSGILVCSENYITWRHQNNPPLRIPIPRRKDALSLKPGANGENAESSKSIIIVSSVVHKLKRGFFFLLQTEEGDLFKLTMDYRVGADLVVGPVESFRVKFFDTIPVAAGMCLLKSGFLFCGSEFGNQMLYQVDNLGDDDDEQPEFSTADFPQGEDAPEVTVTFRPRPLRNLTGVDEIESLSPLVDAKVLNLRDEDTPQIYGLCGRGSRSSFRILRHGLEVNQVTDPAELPGNPNAVWTVRATSRDEFDSYIVVSFVNATLVLSIGETVEEVTDTGFLATTPTLTAGQLGDDALVQVYPQGIRHIRSNRRVSEWKSPGNKAIARAACNQRQVIIALSSGELVYFELDMTGQLNEFQERREMLSPVTALALGPIPEGRQRSKFVAVGCADTSVRILSLDPDTCLTPLATMALSAVPESLCIAELMDTGAERAQGTLYLNAGLNNGVLTRATLDPTTGELSDTRLRFLGARAIKLHRISIQGASAVLALSTRPWLMYTFQSRTRLIPLSYEQLEYASSFSSEPCPEGVVAIVQNTLRILTVEKLGDVFNQSVVPLSYTPRKFAVHEPSRNVIIVEADHNTWCPSDKIKLLSGEDDDRMDVESDDGQAAAPNIRSEPAEELPPDQFGLPRAESGKWASCIRLLNPLTGETLQVIQLDENEAAFSVTVCRFAISPTELFAVVGTAKDTILSPRSCSSGFLRIYSIAMDGTSLTFVHKTAVEDIPSALTPFQGRVLVGMGKILRIYEMGKKKLLRKCENRQFPNCIITLHTQGDRIIVGDIQESVHYCAFKPNDSRIIIFADDTTPRWLSCTTQVDYDTMAGGDKFGNFFIVRLPLEVSQEVDDDPTGTKLLFEKPHLQGAAHKLSRLVEYYVGDTITSVQKTVLVPGGREVILYTTLFGSVGVFIPLVSKEDVEFFQSLEMHMRQEAPPLCGRDHLVYRSSYVPVRGCIDGDLCEQFNLLPAETRRRIAEELDRTAQEVSKKLEDSRTRVAF